VAAVVYGADEPKWGALRSLLDVSTLALNHRFEVVPGVLATESRELVVDFFRRRRR
jgi:tRNA(Arg) A34 adenosine deaminase TadA